MTRNQFMEELGRRLKALNVPDAEEILAEYEEHFDFKLEEGKTEEEIARRLSSPQEIAEEYAAVNRPQNKFERGVKIAGITALSVPLCFVYALMWAAAIVLGAFAACALAAGFCLITTVNIAELIPQMPYLPALLTGISCFGLCVLSAVGCVYAALYVTQWGRCYLNWCRRTVRNSSAPALSALPKVSKKFAYGTKLLAAIGLVVFVAALIAGYAAMCLYAGSLEPWHIWQWFE